MSKYEDIFKGGDLRSIGRANDVVAFIKSQEAFDELVLGLQSLDRKVVMRTADAIEKITLQQSSYLQKHKQMLLNLFQTTENIELKWHLALLVTRLNLTEKEFELIWHKLKQWAIDSNESKIVRVNSLQGLFDLLQIKPEWSKDFFKIVSKIENEMIPSINARIRKIKKTGHT